MMNLLTDFSVYDSHRRCLAWSFEDFSSNLDGTLYISDHIDDNYLLQVILVHLQNDCTYEPLSC